MNDTAVSMLNTEKINALLTSVELENLFNYLLSGSVGSTVAIESALRPAGTFLPRVRAPPPAPWPDGGPESLRSPGCGLAIYKAKTICS
ncbi:hypothetical protein PoB_004085600 [Plakobranchus ocellatus]|uniref:Uncharacterized protein n=1 Tax=Plakobranchus ocellatus TaxID=259542 RepID=A0AAV4ATE0_9GAST|nr:hypothetical protein PoB_004085600 [Plakobranchus ocellatus]